MRNGILNTIVFLSAFSFMGSNALASSSTGGVSSPLVKEGLSTIEWRNGYATDDDGVDDERYRSRVHASYGISDRFGLTLISAVDKRKDQSLQYDSTGLEIDTTLLKQDENGLLSGGIRIAYTLKDGDKKPDSGEIRLMLQRKQGDWDLRANQIFSHEAGEDSEGGLEAETRWQVTNKIMDKVAVGLQGYHEFGRLKEDVDYDDQSHSVGPLARYNVTENVFTEVGYRRGISDGAPDNTFRANLGYSFK